MKYLIGIFSVLCLLYVVRGFGEVNHEQLADKVTNQTIRQLTKEKNLVCVGTGGGMMGLIQKASIMFHSYEPVTLEEARKLIVYATKTYLTNMNASKALRPYLITYPFPPERVDISINIYNPDRSSVNLDQISEARASGGYLFYNRYDNHERIVLYEESYLEGLKIVEEEARNLPPRAKQGAES